MTTAELKTAARAKVMKQLQDGSNYEDTVAWYVQLDDGVKVEVKARVNANGTWVWV